MAELTPFQKQFGGEQAFQFMDKSGYSAKGFEVPAPPGVPVTRYTNQTPPLPSAPGLTPALPAAPTVAKPTLGTVDENSIREQTRQRMQASIDAINANYTNLITQENVAGQDRSGQTRAINARSGLMGSDFGAAQANKTQQFNQQQVKYLEDEKAARVNSVMQNIEDRASAEIQMRKQEALGKYQMEMGDFEKAQEQARGDLQTLAKSRVDLNSLQPAQKAALLKQAGYEDDQFGELIYNAMKPKPQQTDYKFEKLADGRGMFYGVDPNTGELKRIDVNIDLPPDWQVQIAPDGTVIGFDKTTGQAQVLSGKGEFAKPEDPLDQALKQAQIQKILKELEGGADANEVLTPSDAKALGVPYGTTKGQAAQLGITPNSPMSAEAQKLQGNVQSGLRSLATIKKELYGDENKDLNQPGDVRSNILYRSGYLGMAREYKSATNELKDILVRLRTGAAISETEEKFYESQLPQVTDNESTIRAKLRRFEELFNDLVPSRLQNIGSPGDLFQEFENQQLGFNKVGTDTKSGVAKTGMRTDRHNNPTAFTSDIAKLAGLKLGVDYSVGDPFPNNSKFTTAKLLKDPIATTIKVIDKIGFYTQSGKPRWTYTNSIPQTKNWGKLSYTQKADVIKQMYKHEGGSALLNHFA